MSRIGVPRVQRCYTPTSNPAMADITRDSLLAERLDWILETTFLARLTLEEQGSVLGAMSWRRYGAGEVMVRAGSPPPGVDLLIEGQVLVERNGPAAMSRGACLRCGG